MRPKKNVLRIITKLKNGNPFLKSFLLAFLGICFGISSVFGFSNSSISASEKQLFEIKNQYGQYLHIRYHLSLDSDAKRQSLITPLNNFNEYRLQEVGRNASFVSETEYSVKLESKELACNYLVFSDYYSENYSLNRFGLFQGKYIAEEFNSNNSIYISLSTAKYFGGSNLKELIGEKVTLSFDNEEYIIKGIIDESNYYDSPIHFSKMFGDRFILFNSFHLKNYGYTDILFESDDNTFVSDSLDLIKAFNKSYVDYFKVYQSISAYKNGNIDVRNNIIVNNPISTKGILLSICFIALSVIFGLSFLIVLPISKFDVGKKSKKILLFSLNLLWCCAPLIILVLTSFAGMHLFKSSIVASIMFCAISLILLMTTNINSDKKANKEE